MISQLKRIFKALDFPKEEGIPPIKGKVLVRFEGENADHMALKFFKTKKQSETTSVKRCLYWYGDGFSLVEFEKPKEVIAGRGDLRLRR